MSDEQKNTALANIGVVGLAVMGANLARNLASREAIRSLSSTARRDGLVPLSSSIPKRAS